MGFSAGGIQAGEFLMHYDQFEEQYQVIKKMGILTGRIVLDGWPHGFGSDGGWVKEYANWLQRVFLKNQN